MTAGSVNSCVMVHIVTYNNADTIQACLSALLEQVSPDCIRVLDNASSDDTVNRIERMGLPVFKNKINRGYGAAHNQLLQQSESDYVLTLNPDVIVKPGYVRTLQNALDRRPDAGMVMGCLLRIDTIHDEPYMIDSLGLYLQRNRRARLRGEGQPPETCPTTPEAIWGADGAAVCYRRAMLDDIALNGEIFDELFFLQKADIDICWRARLQGWKAWVIPAACAWHIRSFRPGQRQRVSPRLRWLAVRNRYLLLLKNDVPDTFWRHLLPILLYECLILGYLLLRERASLGAYYDIWKNRHRIMARRSQVQVGRRVDDACIRSWYD